MQLLRQTFVFLKTDKKQCCPVGKDLFTVDNELFNVSGFPLYTGVLLKLNRKCEHEDENIGKCIISA